MLAITPGRQQFCHHSGLLVAYIHKIGYSGFMQDDDKLSNQLKVLGHPDRLRLLRLMRTPGAFPGNLVDVLAIGVCINDLAKAAALPQSTTSHHLSLLQKAGLLVVTEHGQWRYVRPAAPALHGLGAEVAGLVS
jgi:DNA-binding transcriptional ArsR family regulator